MTTPIRPESKTSHPKPRAPQPQHLRPLLKNCGLEVKNQTPLGERIHCANCPKSAVASAMRRCQKCADAQLCSLRCLRAHIC